MVPMLVGWAESIPTRDETERPRRPVHSPWKRAADPLAVPAGLARSSESADETGVSPDLAALWQDLLDRRLNVHGAGATATRMYVLARGDAHPDARPGTVSRLETAVLGRVLAGEQQKCVAFELQIAFSTASKWYSRAVEKLHLDGGPVPLPLVIAAQAWASGETPPVDARYAAFDYEGHEYHLLSVPAGTLTSAGGLTPAEQEVALLLVQGESRQTIAGARSTSIETVACQLRGIYSKFQLSGRPSLIRRGTGLGWFR
jgi:DNA-binding NarL/FixJ family response regulator